IKSGVMKRLPMGAKLACGKPSECGQFLKTGKGWVHIRHVQEIGAKRVFDSRNNSVAFAEQLIGAPCSWGGRCDDGQDWSVVVQMILGLKKERDPRETDKQLKDIGSEIGEGGDLTRGKFAFLPGHL